MTRVEVVRYAALVVPCVALATVLRWAPTTRRERGALLLAGIAAFVGLGALHELAGLARWWHFAEVAGSWRGLPVDLWLGWAVLWGPLPVALRRAVGLPVALVGAAWLDVVAMPAMSPIVVLGDGWLWGEAAGLVAVLVPAVLLGRWTAERRRLVARTGLQIVVFAGATFWLLPTTVFTFADGSWATLLDRPYVQLAIAAQVAAVLALPALSAVQELVEGGRGTPFPWDPPVRLVTTGPYAYLANPMQASVTLLLLLLASLTGSWTLAAAAVAAVAFSATVAQPHEGEQLRARFGDELDRYRAEVATWRPRWRPYVVGSATLYVAGDCNLCRQLGAVVTAAAPVQLHAADASDHTAPLRRARYEAGHLGEDGLPAVGRALEHLHLGVAAVGWAVRLPLLRVVLQLIADTVGPQARNAGEANEVAS